MAKNAANHAEKDELRRAPLLPPGFTMVPLRESGDAFAHAVKIAPEAGAATLVWVRRFDLVEFALVLEPDQPLMMARLAHYLCMNALADALAVHCPPERPILFSWPDALMYDHGLMGGGRLASAQNCAETDVPEWIVFGAMVRASRRTPFDDQPGMQPEMQAGSNPDAKLHPMGTAMDEEGFEDVDAVDLVESFARHVMLGVSRWESDGPKATVKRWLDRLEKKPGFRHGIEPNGDLIITSQTGVERRSFVEALHHPVWFDAAEGAPKL